MVASRANVSRSPLRFPKAYVVSISGVVDFITGRRHWIRSSEVLAAVASLVEPGGDDGLVDRGGTGSAP